MRTYLHLPTLFRNDGTTLHWFTSLSRVQRKEQWHHNFSLSYRYTSVSSVLLCWTNTTIWICTWNMSTSCDTLGIATARTVFRSRDHTKRDKTNNNKASHKCRYRRHIQTWPTRLTSPNRLNFTWGNDRLASPLRLSRRRTHASTDHDINSILFFPPRHLVFLAQTNKKQAATDDMNMTLREKQPSCAQSTEPIYYHTQTYTQTYTHTHAWLLKGRHVTPEKGRKQMMKVKAVWSVMTDCCTGPWTRKQLAK